MSFRNYQKLFVKKIQHKCKTFLGSGSMLKDSKFVKEIVANLVFETIAHKLMFPKRSPNSISPLLSPFSIENTATLLPNWPSTLFHRWWRGRHSSITIWKSYTFVALPTSMYDICVTAVHPKNIYTEVAPNFLGSLTSSQIFTFHVMLNWKFFITYDKK